MLADHFDRFDGRAAPEGLGRGQSLHRTERIRLPSHTVSERAARFTSDARASRRVEDREEIGEVSVRESVLNTTPRARVSATLLALPHGQPWSAPALYRGAPQFDRGASESPWRPASSSVGVAMPPPGLLNPWTRRRRYPTPTICATCLVANDEQRPHCRLLAREPPAWIDKRKNVSSASAAEEAFGRRTEERDRNGGRALSVGSNVAFSDLPTGPRERRRGRQCSLRYR